MSLPSARDVRTGLALVAMLSSLTSCGESAPTGPGEADVASVSVAAPSDEVDAGLTLQLSATVLPSNAAQGVTWLTSDDGTATVDASGLVTGVTPGVVTITATSAADVSRSGDIEITVTCRTIVQSMVEDGGTLDAEECYRVLTALSVNDGTLEIQAGADVRFGVGGSLTIAPAGRLAAIGTADDPVVLTSLDEGVRWRGIRFNGSGGLDNRLEHVILEDGGSAAWTGAAHTRAALLLQGATRLTVTASEITGSGGQGLSAEGDVEVTVAGSTFAENVVPAWVHPDVVQGFAPDNVFDGNDEEMIRVGFGNNDAVTMAQSWADLSVPLEIQTRMLVDAPLTLEPGVELLFEADASMIVQGGGTLTAQGTADAQIRFSGSEALRGYWKGLQITTQSTSNVFDHVVFEHGGGSTWTGDPDSRAMVFLTGNSRALFTNSTFRDSDHYALWVPAGGAIPAFSDNFIEGNRRTMVVHPNRVGTIESNTFFGDNDEMRVRVSFGNTDAVESASTWQALAVPYLITVRTFVRASLSIESGAVLEFAQDASLVVTDDGSLAAYGTPDSPVLFTAPEPLQGYWKGIEFGTASTSNLLSNTVLEYAGSQPWFGGDPAIATLYVTPTGVLELDAVTIRDTGGYALILGDGGSVTCSNVAIEGAAVGDFYDQATSTASGTCPG